ncbi:YdeI/OmpD-associated family protein [Verrucomicrobiota bacterium sgz303538]
MSPTFFATATEFRAWLEAHHEIAAELWVGFYKTGTGKPSITWPQAVDEALCVGWIDGLRKSLGELSYMIRFTPRKSQSTWSAVNIGRVEALADEGRMRPAGLRAFQARTESKSKIYSYEQKDDAKLDEEAEAQFRSQREAWAYFHSQAPSYKKTAIWWVVSAKRDETRRKRLATLIEDSANQRRLAHLNWRKKAA